MSPAIEKLLSEFAQITDSNSYSVHMQFVKELLSDNTPEVIDLHYQLLKKTTQNNDLYQEIRRAFEKRGSVGITYLVNQFELEKDSYYKSEIIYILGKMRASIVIPLAIDSIQETSRDLRYKAIIVLGWVGRFSEIPILDDRLRNEPDVELRGYAATAMRQIWYKYPETKQEVLRCYAKAIDGEMSQWVLTCIITCTQDLLLRKFGVKETPYGDVSGNIEKAKIKASAALKEFLV